ncbi:unnamed protein product [Cyclocybe aegerita]|uniref:Uncharacterized protein n=1 Tax=Cyclocybe aegerita TaxID=1973307 RepID=A0A8S0VTU7_CYCAE|nr:unnamed protein product [Cyclocybe aegerita]
MDTYRLAGPASRALHIDDLQPKKVTVSKGPWQILMKNELHATNVSHNHISEIAAGCDDAGQHHGLQSHIYSRATWRYSPRASLEPQAHYRFLQGAVDIHLSEFSNPRQLMMAIADAFDGELLFLSTTTILIDVQFFSS